MATKMLAGTFGERLTAARGDLSMAEVVYRVRTLLGGYHLSVATISRYESGATKEEVADPVVVCALAKVLDVPLDDLSPRAAALYAALVGRSGCPGAGPDGTPFFGLAA